MKKFLLLCLLLYSSICAAQRYNQIDRCRYEALYTLSYKLDSTQLTDVKSEDFILQIGDSLAVFESYNQYRADSIYIARQIWNASANEAMALIIDRPRTQFDYRVIRRKGSSLLEFQERIILDTYGYDEDMTSLHWEIQPDSRVIDGYTCQKATTYYAGRDYEAWFCPEIPIPYGPYKFGGLPGLILHLYDTKRHYDFELIILRKGTERFIYASAKKILKATKEKFNLIKRRINESWGQELERTIGSQFTIESNGRRKTVQEMDQLGREEMKSKNNPIELKIL